MSEFAEQTADIVAENVEDVLDGVVEVVEVVRNSPVLMAGFFTGGILVGLGGGYLIAKKILRKQYEELATEEIAQAKEFYSNLNKVDDEGESLSPQQVMEMRHGTEAAAEALRVYQGEVEEPVLEGEPYDDIRDEELLRKIESSVTKKTDPVLAGLEEESKKIHVFSDSTFDLKEEMKYRTEDKPYIITHDEFFAAEKEYETMSLTYYETDDTLVDESDKPIDNVDGSIGEDHLVRFGSGSKDNNIVYVRNDSLETDYEIVRSKGSYLEEVLGMLDDDSNSLKHSDQRDRRRAFRHGDG